MSFLSFTLLILSMSHWKGRMSDCELNPVAWMPAGLKPQEFLKLIWTVTSKEQGVLEVLSSKTKTWVSQWAQMDVGGRGTVPLSSILCAQLHFCKIQKAALHLW